MAATTLREYLTQALPALMEIPGFTQLMDAEGERYDALAQAYPDAVFAIMAMNNLFHHDREFSEIHQKAFSSIIEGEEIASVRFRYNRSMDAYLQAHLWDD